MKGLMEKKKDVLDIFSKIMFFSSWSSPNQSLKNKKKREEDIEFVFSELERLVEIDRLNNALKNIESYQALNEVKNGLLGHCRSSYLKETPEELQKIIDIYTNYFNKIENTLKEKVELENQLQASFMAIEKHIQYEKDIVKWYQESGREKECSLNEKINKLCEQLEKQDKILKIFKKVITYDFEENDNDMPEYMSNDVITKDEYDLLKEYLYENNKK